MSLVALLPSPLLGCAMWQPVASVLKELGRRVVAIDVGGPAPATAQDALRAYLRALPDDDELVLVPHSNAGLYVPAVAEHREVGAAVFVDAGLPPLGGGGAPTVPVGFFAMIAGKADDRRMLPVWTEWWDEQEIAALFPDARSRADIERQQRRLPLSYVEDAVPVPSGWAHRPCAYLAFGETYQAEVETARRLGWPVRTLDGKHLEMVVHPMAVANAILSLLAEADHR